MSVQDMPASETSMFSPCSRFEDKFEFYSPGYPGPYPNNTECIRTLEGTHFYLLIIYLNLQFKLLLV